MRALVRKTMMEKDKMRGLVPSRAFGSHDKVYTAYLDNLGVRDNEKIQIALANCPDSRFQEFLSRLLTARYKRIGTATIAKACDISLKEFQDWWNREATQAAIAVAQNASVSIAQDMAKDAASINAVCERCDGMRWIGAPQGMPLETPGYRPMVADGLTVWIRDCPNCINGKVSRPGDTHARDRLLEMSGVIKRGGGVNVNINNLGGAAHPSSISALDNVMTLDVTSE